MTGVLEEKLGVQELIQDFIESLEVEKGRSRKTAENYERYFPFSVTLEVWKHASVFRKNCGTCW